MMNDDVFYVALTAFGKKGGATNTSLLTLLVVVSPRVELVEIAAHSTLVIVTQPLLAAPGALIPFG